MNAMNTQSKLSRIDLTPYRKEERETPDISHYETVDQFLARGGKIAQVERGTGNFDHTLVHCTCRCKGVISRHKPSKARKRQHGIKKV